MFTENFLGISFEDHEEVEEDTIVETEPDTPEEDKSVRETEYVWYVRILDFKQLSKASHAEKQEQWMIKIPRTADNASEGSIRVRKNTSSTGEVTYETTVKNKAKSGQFENTAQCSEGYFTQMAFLADKGMNKQRYCFPVEGSDLCWEVDVYPDGKQGYYTWARIELEAKGELDQFPPLPIEVEETISPEDQQTDEGQAKVRELFDTYFLINNKYAVQEGLVEDTEEEKPDISHDGQSDDSDETESDDLDTDDVEDTDESGDDSSEEADDESDTDEPEESEPEEDDDAEAESEDDGEDDSEEQS